MESQFILKVGSKGEIFPPKEIRTATGLEPGQKILLQVHGKHILIQKIESAEDILNRPAKAKISYHVLQDLESEFE
ncbi:MAG: AbrB/MazE/SpoVT family DNA-binding domain-containing protein [Promethearchaeota archaeon]|nr:MAG: AbrB/MazE/SpoVT family DNA-binding domain-containing protein [Candidatus Lokiarchaeota archaeon]